ncbi:MAG: tRNA-specific adenosine deaminase [Ignavibacteriae bacterium HGW-Ignavibacteriae-1]|jgi:tRNA(adenine34) deaminase|nr:MAG: tRNA-specific adenosine deaminase [Ignavibacteriae bacterium HGW-Ignavibacteriae-1]
MKSVHHKYMLLALEQARKAITHGDVPVGAIVVRNEEIIGTGYNMVEKLGDPTLHAEIIALREASENIGAKFVYDSTLYVTLEPCIMCTGAIVLARMKCIVYGADDPKMGACGSLFSIPAEPKLNHTVEVIGGIMSDVCGKLLKDFFEKLRIQKDN